MNRNQEIIAEYTGWTDPDVLVTMERVARRLAGDLWDDLDRDDLEHVLARVLSGETPKAEPHVLRFRYGGGSVPYSTNHRTVLDLARSEEIALINRRLTAGEVHERLLAGRPVYAGGSRYEMEKGT